MGNYKLGKDYKGVRYYEKESTYIVKFYADKKGQYTNHPFRFDLQRKESLKGYQNTVQEAEYRAKSIVYHFIKHGNNIRAAFLEINGISTRLFDRVVKDGRQLKYVFDYWN